MHGEVDTKDSHQILLPSTPRPRVGAPPLPHFLPCFGKLVRVPMVRFLPSPRTSRAELSPALAQGREEGCVCVEEGNKVDQ